MDGNIDVRPTQRSKIIIERRLGDTEHLSKCSLIIAKRAMERVEALGYISVGTATIGHGRLMPVSRRERK